MCLCVCEREREITGVQLYVSQPTQVSKMSAISKQTNKKVEKRGQAAIT